MGVSDEAKNVIPLKFLRKIKNKNFFPLEKLNPGTYCILFITNFLKFSFKEKYNLISTLNLED
jgi:hypothetical protein